jgi:hypothetical protein
VVLVVVMVVVGGSPFLCLLGWVAYKKDGGIQIATISLQDSRHICKVWFFFPPPMSLFCGRSGRWVRF